MTGWGLLEELGSLDTVGTGVLVGVGLLILPGLFTLLQAAKVLILRRTKGIAIAVIIAFLPEGLARRYLITIMIIAVMLTSILIIASNGPLALRKLYMSIWSRSLSFCLLCLMGYLLQAFLF